MKRPPCEERLLFFIIIITINELITIGDDISIKTEDI